jgi:kynureninase
MQAKFSALARDSIRYITSHPKCSVISVAPINSQLPATAHLERLTFVREQSFYLTQTLIQRARVLS